MARILYLVHRLPYPPNKGDKVRSFHVLRHLAQRHDVYLGTFVDDPEDRQHLSTVRTWCREAYVAELDPMRARFASLSAFLSGGPMTLRYYQNAGLRRWVQTLHDRGTIDATVVFSSSMAQYVPAGGTDGPVLVDFVDVDSAKWSEYALRHRWPLSWLYRREGRHLLAYERQVARRARRSFFVTQKETDVFRRQAPECADAIETVANGVDADFFRPDFGIPNPFNAEAPTLVFTGAMDYWPNVDAVRWFATAILPALRVMHPTLRFCIVGRSPTPEVRALASDVIAVTGTVPDVRPYLQHAAVVVAPLRLARGIQNKILEAMAMARPVVAASECTEALEAEIGTDLLAATSAQDHVTQIDALLRDAEHARRIGAAARRRVCASYAWSSNLAVLDRYLEPDALPAAPL